MRLPFKPCGHQLVILGVGLLVFSSAKAQTEPAAFPKKTTEYFDVGDKKLPSAEGADHRVETTYRDSATGTVRVYYPSGKVKAIRPYGNMRYKVLHGTVTTWYETGQMHTKEDYVAGKRNGELLVYYADGKVRRRDQFEKDQHTAGECFGPDGQPVTYFDYTQMPVYPGSEGSNAGIVQAIASHVRYPKEALMAQLKARIFIAFDVNKQGRVQNIRIPEGSRMTSVPAKHLLALSKMEEAVISSAKQLAVFTPGMQDGEPMTVSYTVPVTFDIK
jgi:protein TonB